MPLSCIPAGSRRKMPVERSSGRRVPTSGVAEVFRDRVTQQTFHLTTGTVELRLLRADGTPAPDTKLRFDSRDGRGPQQLPPTDADGRLVIDWSVGTLTVSAQRSRDDRAELGTVEVRPGQRTSAEFRLPAGW